METIRSLKEYFKVNLNDGTFNVWSGWVHLSNEMVWSYTDVFVFHNGYSEVDHYI